MSNAQAATVTDNGVLSVQEETPAFKVFLYLFSTLSTISHVLSQRSLLEILPTLQPMMG